MTTRLWLIAALTATTAGSTAHADEPAPRQVPVIQQVYECRAITDPQQRLACFDRQVAAMQAAEQSRDIRIVDREAVRETRRGLFGFSLGGLNLFGGGNDDEQTADSDAVNEIESTINDIARNGDGRAVFALANGQRWVQVDAAARGRSPRAGETIRIRRAAMGSYMANINGRQAIRIRREQ